MKNDKLINAILESDISTEIKAELIKQLKCNRDKEAIITILKFIGISAKIISLFKD